ncbi:anti-sigma-I factor RsgI2-like isoform X2 [Dendropsophus ebraccatus]|uniref:anti-sigma-I factor RsgI2-like isoform X2 n=1 Tax=Dendropsophus ebraccatus TaxID=150705 RepID=UPI003831F14C
MTLILDYDKIPAMTPAPADNGEIPAVTPAPADHGELPTITPAPADHEEIPALTPAPADNGDLQDMTPIPEYDKIPAMTPAPADDGEKPAMTPAPADDKDLQDITPVPDYDEISAMTLAPADDAGEYDCILLYRRPERLWRLRFYIIQEDVMLYLGFICNIKHLSFSLSILDLQDMTPIPDYDKISAMTPLPADDAGEYDRIRLYGRPERLWRLRYYIIQEDVMLYLGFIFNIKHLSFSLSISDLQDMTPIPDYDEIPDMTLAPADDGDSPDITPVPDYYDLPDITPVPDYDEIPAMTPAPAGDGELPTITPAPADHEGLKSPAVTPPPSPTSPTSPASLSLSDDNSSILTDKIKGAFIAAVIVVFMIAAVICIVKVFRIKPSEPTIV